MSERGNIARAAGVVGAATMLSRIMGMLRDMVVSRLFGAGMYTDAFFAAFQIPNMLRRFFAEGALTSAFVPTFSEWYTRKGEQEARDLANVCFTVLTIVMAAITILGIVLSPQLVALMFPGFAGNPEKVRVTVLLNRLMFPYIFFVCQVALCMGILNTVRHFFTPAISTVFLNISIILAALFLRGPFEVPIVALAVGVLIGGALQLLLQLPVLYKRGFRIRPNFDFRHPAVRRIALLMGPSVFGVGVYYLNITVGGILASLLPEGSVSYLYYAQRLFEFPQGIFTVSVAQAVLPSMSRQAAMGDLDALKESLSYGVRLTLFITIPAMVGLIFCATPIFSLLFMGGAFDFAKAQNCGVALLYYSVGLSFVALVRVLVPAFYAMKDTKTPVFTAFVAFLLNLLFSVALMGPMKHGGLALASSLSALANMWLLLYFLRKKVGHFGGRAIAGAGFKGLVASIPMAAAVYWIMQMIDWSQDGARLLKGGGDGAGGRRRHRDLPLHRTTAGVRGGQGRARLGEEKACKIQGVESSIRKKEAGWRRPLHVPPPSRGRTGGGWGHLRQLYPIPTPTLPLKGRGKRNGQKGACMRKQDTATACSIYQTAAGFGLLAASNDGLVAHHLPFGVTSQAQARELLATHHPEATRESSLTIAAADLVSRYFAGERLDFDLPFDLGGFTEFQKRVYRVVAGIGYGSVMSYGEVASRCGCPRGARAIGGAMARNRLPVLIPCHRVLGATGHMTGFTAPGGVESKRNLLAMEGVVLGASGGIFQAGAARL